MAIADLRSLDVARLRSDEIDDLIALGEPAMLERKRSPGQPFAEAVAAMANTRGGIVLLGVEDKGGVADGWPVEGQQLDAQSHLGDILRNLVSPLPPFVVAVYPYGGKSIGVVRVFESADTPHVMRSTGAVRVRTPKGNQAITTHTELIALVDRGRQARAAATDRFRALDPVAALISPRDARDRGAGTLAIFAAPVTVPPAFTAAAVTMLADGVGKHAMREHCHVWPTLRAHARGVTFVADTGQGKLTLVVDGRGVVAARWEVVGANAPVDEAARIGQLARTVEQVLSGLGAVGAVEYRWEFAAGNMGDSLELYPVLITRSLSIPIDVDAEVASVMRELQRHLGTWAPDPDPSDRAGSID